MFATGNAAFLCSCSAQVRYLAYRGNPHVLNPGTMAPGGHHPVPQDEEECRDDVVNSVPTWRRRTCKLSCLVFTLFTVSVLILLGTSTPPSAKLKAWIVKVSSELQEFSRNPPLFPFGPEPPTRTSATGLCTNGKFKNNPRIRREWRELGEDELKAVQDAFWHLKGFSRVASGGNAAGYAADAEYADTEAGKAKCKELNDAEADDAKKNLVLIQCEILFVSFQNISTLSPLSFDCNPWFFLVFPKS